MYGPNGFFREFSGSAEDPGISIFCEYEKPGKLIKKHTGNIDLKIINLNPGKTFTVEIRDNAYKNKSIKKILAPVDARNDDGESIILNLNKSFGWYDFSILAEGFNHFKRRYSGHVETGKASFTDPAMGNA